VDCTTELAEVLWRPGPSNNDPITEFRVYYRDWSPDARGQPAFNRSALTVGAELSRSSHRYDLMTKSEICGVLDAFQCVVVVFVISITDKHNT